MLDGKLYAVGGYDGGNLSSVEWYDPALDAWEAVAPMATARCHLAVAVLDGKLYAVWEAATTTTTATSARRSAALDAWEEVAPMRAARVNGAVLM